MLNQIIVSNQVTDVLDKITSFLDSIPGIIVGAIYLILALIVALVVKAIIVSILRKTGLERKLNNLENRGSEDKKTKGMPAGSRAVSIIGKLVFLLIFLLFLPAALDKFGMQSVTAPITDLVHDFVDYIPRVVACLVILVIGFFIANLIRQILVALIGATKVDKLQEKLSKGKFHVDIAKIIGTVAYVFLVTVVLICSLNVLNIEAISRPTTELLSTVISAIPAILVALIVLFVGVFLAGLVGSLLESLLSSFHLDERLNGWLYGKEEKEGKSASISVVAVLVGIVKAVIIVLFTVEAINTLKFEILTFVGTAVIGFLPAALVAVIVFLAAFFVCRIIDVRSGMAQTVSRIVKAAIYTVAAFIALSQLGIAPAIVNTAFIVVLVSFGVAFAVAVGIGGIPFVKNLLSQVKIGCKKNAEKPEEKDQNNDKSN